MYEAYFGLREPPFSITPDPAYVYLSRHHREALAHLLYGTGENGSFMQLTGEVGTGKTTLVRTLLEQDLHQVDIALCLHPRLTVEDLLATVCDELGVAYPREHLTLKTLLDVLNAHLLRAHAAGRRTVLIIDEAQNLSREVLEQIRLLTNLETTKHKLLRIILVGQPELRQLLARPDLRQLTQRITAYYHLPSLGPQDTAAYIQHRLQVAGGKDEGLFSDAALRAVHQWSGGIPRLINILCDRALLGAYSQNLRQVNSNLVRHAARETLQRGARQPEWSTWVGVGIGALVIGLGLWLPHLAGWPFDIAAPARAPAPVSTRTAERNVSVTPLQPAVTPPHPTVIPSTSTTVAPLTTTRPSDLNSWLAQSTDEIANNRLLAIWGIAKPVKGKATRLCEQVNSYALRCLVGRGDWDEIRRLDRPVLLRLERSEGAPTPVVLLSLKGDDATLVVANETTSVPLSQLTPLWTGYFVLLWRPPAELTELNVVGPGNSGDAVRWVRKRLALAAGQPASEPLSEVFDAALAAQIRQFQQGRGLSPDGMAGERTLIVLDNLALPAGTPTLGTSSRKL